MAEPLKPCPFCGASAVETTTLIDTADGVRPSSAVQCRECCAEVVGLTPPIARQGWNLRTDPARDDLLAAAKLAMDACQDNLKAWQYKNEPALREAFHALSAAIAKAEGGAL